MRLKGRQDNSRAVWMLEKVDRDESFMVQWILPLRVLQPNHWKVFYLLLQMHVRWLTERLSFETLPDLSVLFTKQTIWNYVNYHADFPLVIRPELVLLNIFWSYLLRAYGSIFYDFSESWDNDEDKIPGSVFLIVTLRKLPFYSLWFIFLLL